MAPKGGRLSSCQIIKESGFEEFSFENILPLQSVLVLKFEIEINRL